MVCCSHEAVVEVSEVFIGRGDSHWPTLRIGYVIQWPVLFEVLWSMPLYLTVEVEKVRLLRILSKVHGGKMLWNARASMHRYARNHLSRIGIVSLNINHLRTVIIGIDVHHCDRTRHFFEGTTLGLAFLCFGSAILRRIVPIVTAPVASRFHTVWVDHLERIVECIGILVPSLRIAQISLQVPAGIRRHEAAHRRRIVPGPEVVESGSRISFFAGLTG